MEHNLSRAMDEIISEPGVNGCIFADYQGLCLGAKGKISPDSAGDIVAIAEQAAKLEPKSKTPVISFKSDNSLFIIQQNGTVTGAIYKNTQ